MSAFTNIENVVNQHGWSVEWGARKGKNEGLFVEFHHPTTSGDDFSFSVPYRIPIDIIRGVKQYAFNFDIDGYIENSVDSYYGCEEPIQLPRSRKPRTRSFSRAEEIDKLLFDLSGVLLDELYAICCLEMGSCL